MKKDILLFSVLVFAVLMVSGCDTGLGTNNGHNQISLSSIRSVANDPVANCAVEEVHQHNGVHYGGHYNNDGHGHHGLQANDICIVTNCEETGIHQHNGTHYAGHHGSDGHNGHGGGHHE
jgi:hypothetical protein